MVGLDPADQLDAVHPGEPPVGQHKVDVLRLERLERLLRALDRQHLVAPELERPVERPQKDLVVIDEQEPALHVAPPAREWATATVGREICTRVPLPGTLSTTTSPP